jgi:hypothetical protein
MKYTEHKYLNIPIAGQEGVMPGEAYVTITIQMNLNYRLFQDKNLGDEFLEELSYNIGSGKIYNHKFCEGCVSFRADIPLRAGQRLLEVWFIRNAPDKLDFQSVKDLNSFIAQFKITKIFSHDLETDKTGKAFIIGVSEHTLV